MARRDVVLLAALVAIVVALAALVGGVDRGEGANDPRPSTHLTGEGGAAALYWTLQELDLPVARRGRPLVPGPAPEGGLVLLAPSIDLTPAEVATVLGRVRAGGLLVVAASPWDMGEAPLHDSLGLVPRPVRRMQITGIAARPTPHPWTVGVDSIRGFRAVFADTSAALAAPRARVLLATAQGAAGVLLPMGEGSVLALADIGPLTNARLRESGVAPFLARAAAASGDTLWFDEFHHGFRDAESAGVGTLRRLARVLPQGFWLHLAVLAALGLLVGARRFGAPYPAPAPERRSPLEHVEALAGAYRQAGARRTAARLLVAGLSRRMGRRPPPDDDAADEALERLGHGSPAAAEAVASVRRERRRGREADLTNIATDIDRILEEVRRT